MIRRILAIIRKDILVRFASPSELLFFLVLPVVFTLLLSGFAGGDDGADGLLLPVVGTDGPMAAQLLAELETSEAVAPALVTLPEGEELLEDEEAAALLLLPADFDVRLRQAEPLALTLRTLPGSTDAVAIQQAVRAAAARAARAATIARTATEAAADLQPFADEGARQTYYEESLEAAVAALDEAPERLEVREAFREAEDDYSPAAQASAGQLITWVLIPLLGTSALFAYERRQGTLRRLFTTPASGATFLLGTILSQLLMALVQMLLLVGFGIFVLNLDWGDSPLALLLTLVAFGLAAVAFGILLGTFVKTEGQASGLSIMLGMAMGLLGGCWYPLELFPPAVQTAARVLPTTWAMQGLLDLIVRDGGLGAVLPEVGVLLGFAVLFFAVGVARFQYE
jgi:ABC-2 type transport system permease protein